MTILKGSISLALRKRLFPEGAFVFICVLLLILGSSQAHSNESYQIDGSIIKLTRNGSVKICTLDAKPKYAEKNAVKSHDGSAIMVSYQGYVPTTELDQCRPGRTLHVRFIPEKAGVLSDINLKAGIYVALSIVSTAPTVNASALVARIGTTKSLLALDGAYNPKKSLSELQEHSFFVVGSGIGQAIISLDGKYVSPSGAVDCSEDSDPGVWDIKKNKRVITDKDSCSRLFDLGKN